MKKIFIICLMAIFSFVFNTVNARTGNTKDLKTTSANNAKTTTGADPKAGSSKDPSDTAVGNPTLHFYKPKTKRFINLEDIYVGVGGGFKKSEGDNTPFQSGLSANGTYGVPLINKYLLFEFNNSLDFLFLPDMNWFSKAYSIPKSQLHGISSGLDDEFSLDLQVVIAGSRKLSFTAGPCAGARITDLPSVLYNRRLYHLSVPVSICYELKANLFIGDKIYCYAQYSNILARSLTSYASQVVGDEQQFAKRIPAGFGSINLGLGYVLKPWW